MTVLSATKMEEFDDFDGSDSYNTITRVYLLETDGADTEDHDVVDDAITNGFLPAAGGELDTNTIYRAKRLRCRRIDPEFKRWRAEVQYDNKPVEYSPQESGTPEINATTPNGANPATADDPTQDPPIINISGREESFPLWADIAGRPIINTAFSPLEPVPMGHFQNTVVTIEKNSSSPTDYSNINGTINDNDLVVYDSYGAFQFHIPALYGLLQVETSGPYLRKQSTGSVSRFWKTRFEIEVRRVFMPVSVFTDLQVWSYAPLLKSFARVDTGFHQETINGVAYKQLPWGDYLANVGYWRALPDAPSVYSTGVDYEIGNRVQFTSGGKTQRFVCQKSHSATTPHPPVIDADTIYWNQYGHSASGIYQQRILFSMIDPSADAEHAASPIDTPAWLNTSGGIRREDTTLGVDPFIYLYSLTHFPAKWHLATGFPGNTTTT